VQLENKLRDMGQETDEAAVNDDSPNASVLTDTPLGSESQAMDASFMSESIYEKIPSPKSWRQKTISSCFLQSYCDICC
jgi:division protein 1